MGVHLYLKHKTGITIELGRAYHYEIEENWNPVIDLKALAAYSPKDIEEMGEAVRTVDEAIEEIKKLGAKELIDYILLDNEFEIHKE